MTRTLEDLVSGLDARIDGPERAEIRDVSYDSRKVSPGALFVALRGARSDGHRHLEAAIDAGASALLVEQPPASRPEHVAVARVRDTRAALAFLQAELGQGSG